LIGLDIDIIHPWNVLGN